MSQRKANNYYKMKITLMLFENRPALSKQIHPFNFKIVQSSPHTMALAVYRKLEMRTYIIIILLDATHLF